MFLVSLSGKKRNGNFFQKPCLPFAHFKSESQTHEDSQDSPDTSVLILKKSFQNEMISPPENVFIAFPTGMFESCEQS